MIESLQILRAAAALLVVWYHLHGLLVARAVELGLSGRFWSLPHTPVASFGSIGVDIFFVLSGFIIFYTTWHRQVSWVGFIKRRFIRIYPLWWVAVLVAVALSFLPGVTLDFDRAEVFYSFLLVPFYSSEGAVVPIVEVGWTLGYEIYFYLMFSFLIRLRPRIRLFCLTAVFVAAVMSSVVFEPLIALQEVATNVRVLEFIAGGWLAYLFMEGHVARKQWSVFAATLWGALAASYFFLYDHEGLQPSDALYSFVFASLSLYCGLFIPSIARYKYPRLFVLMGDASYSIYLFHSFLIFFFSGMWKRGMLLPPGWLPAELLWLLLLLLLLAFGVAVHLVLERAVLRMCKRFLLRRDTQPSSLPDSPVIPVREATAKSRPDGSVDRNLR